MSDSAKFSEQDRDPDIDEIGRILARRLRRIAREADLCVDLGLAMNSDHKRKPTDAAPESTVAPAEARRAATRGPSSEPYILARFPAIGRSDRAVDIEVFADRHPNSLFARRLETLATTLTSGDADGGRVVTLAPLDPGAGATSLAICLAERVGKAGKRVLLIDTDETDRGFSRLKNIAGRPGLADVLAGKSSASKAVIRRPDFKVLPVGRTPLRAARATNALHAFLEETRRRFDLILIDAPVFGLDGGALALGQLSDAFALVASYDRLVPRAFIAAIDSVAEEPAFAGVILNRTAADDLDVVTS